MALASCNRGAKSGTQPAEAERPLAEYIVQRLSVAPTAVVRGGDSLGWVQQSGGTRPVARRLDSAIVNALSARGLGQRWIFPAELNRAFERNRTYAPDPYQLAVEPIRSPKFVAGEKFVEPLSSQLRTMIALHEDARFVMLPIELRFDKLGTSARAVLRLAILDPRFAEARWVGDVTSDTTAAPALALASVARRLADLFVAP
jgi:hypothetical protein